MERDLGIGPAYHKRVRWNPVNGEIACLDCDRIDRGAQVDDEVHWLSIDHAIQAGTVVVTRKAARENEFLYRSNALNVPFAFVPSQFALSAHTV